MVPDARVAGHGASRGALLITDQCRLRCLASNRGQSAEADPSFLDMPRGAPPRGQRYSRFPIRAV